MMNPRQRFLLISAAAVFVGLVGDFMADKRDAGTERRNSIRPSDHYPTLRDWSRSNLMQEEQSDQNIVLNSTSNAGPVARDTRQEDRTFLDDLVHRIDRPETSNSRPKPVPRAELVSNTEMVKQG